MVSTVSPINKRRRRTATLITMVLAANSSACAYMVSSSIAGSEASATHVFFDQLSKPPTLSQRGQKVGSLLPAARSGTDRVSSQYDYDYLRLAVSAQDLGLQALEGMRHAIDGPTLPCCRHGQQSSPGTLIAIGSPVVEQAQAMLNHSAHRLALLSLGFVGVILARRHKRKNDEYSDA